MTAPAPDLPETMSALIGRAGGDWTLTETPLPVECAWPADSVWPALADQPLAEPSEAPQLVPSECATPVA